MSGALVLGLHLATAHLGAAQGLQAATPGIYLRTEAGLTAGVYRNSNGRTSSYAGWTWETEGRGLALTLGAVTGYAAAPVMPLVVPSARLPLAAGLALRLAYVPKPPRAGSAAGLHLSVERALP